MTQRVAPVNNLFDYFQERVEDAKRQRSLAALSDDATLYLASMLAERARSDRPAPPEQTLAELHASAASAPPASQIRQYRELGDRALYLLGYFRENVARRSVGVSYYEDMGSAAYHRVDLGFKRWFADAFGQVFHELAERFRECVGVLEHVRGVADEPGSLPRLLDEWQRTGSEDAAARLRRLGVLIPKSRADDA